MKKDDIFGNRMKDLESVYTSAKIEPPAVLCVRIDGKGFSKFTKGFKKPFDDGLSETMIKTTERLVKETHASIGYVQSDEISLFYTPNENGHEYIFGGKTSKINSVFASMAAANFNALLTQYSIVDKLAYFDCRAFAAPSLVEASNVLLWRVQDARKNSVSSLFRWTAGHKAMDKLDQAGMKSYLLDYKKTDWNDLPNKYKYGTYVKPVVTETYLSTEELAKIPEAKRPDASVKVKRTKIECVDIGYYGDLSLEQRVEFLK
jgi:tRNA(His) guanylyltransferase